MSERATPEFQEWPKIPRLRRDIVVTEKIDGTNAQLHIEDDVIWVGSRNRWLGYVAPEPSCAVGENYGFFSWVKSNYAELLTLGPGRHYGEWFGKGIQRGYGLEDKRLALFNVWRLDELPPGVVKVPILYVGPWDAFDMPYHLAALHIGGSVLVPGYPKPEGIIIYHGASRSRYKVLLENDDAPKGEAA